MVGGRRERKEGRRVCVKEGERERGMEGGGEGERLEHSRSLPRQGELHRLMEGDAATLWSDTVQKLPPEALKFALNAAQDTLPHNANLAIWRRSEGLNILRIK